MLDICDEDRNLHQQAIALSLHTNALYDDDFCGNENGLQSSRVRRASNRKPVVILD